METLKISERLRAVAALIQKGNAVADVGTDHAYLPIHIVSQGISKQVIAMDVRKGPLEKAKENILHYGIANRVSVRLSDGLDKLEPLEAQTITICGMGGKLIQSILENGRGKYDRNTQLIVSPQSEIRDFREYLDTNGYFISEEVMIREDGQFYLIIECFRNEEKSAEKCQADAKEIKRLPHSLRETELRYGKRLLEKRDEILKEYLEREKEIAYRVYAKVSGIPEQNEAVQKRLAQITEDIQCMNKALAYYNASKD